MIGLCPRMISMTTARNAMSSATPVPRSIVTFLPHFAGHFQSRPFAKMSLAQETVAGEANDRPTRCGLRVQAVRSSRVFAAASQ
jgi:hypothetical protein